MKLELEQTKKAKADAESTWAEELQLQAERMRELQEKLKKDSARASALEKQVDSLKTKPNEWLSELRWINGQMAGESSARVLPPSLL